MNSIFDKFDNDTNLSSLQTEIAEAEANIREFKEVPHGNYEVKVQQMELKESKNGKPMVSIWFKIVSGEFKNSIIFMNQVVTSGFQIHIVNQMIKDLTDGQVVPKFTTYKEYADVIWDAYEMSANYEYELEYGERKGFNTFKIKDVFDVEE